ncbi:MAG: hypothetical protein FJ280_10195 [Planctomycetes bacterium]|nr:hypothetical protein [Planctomycetota bacterium]
MNLPLICLRCAKQECKDSTPGELHVCDHEVAYYNTGSALLRTESAVPFRNVSTNLRHELHHILQLIVEQANMMDPTLSTRRLDVNNPASRILGATIIIDHFIQMLAGVYEFHPDDTGAVQVGRRALAELTKKYFGIYSMVKSAHRSTGLKLTLDFPESALLPHALDIYEYLLALLIDNAWKYSLPGTTLTVRANQKSRYIGDISFRNVSEPLPQSMDVFARGTKARSDGPGFGYGLHWATILVDHYNRLVERPGEPLQITHRQTMRSNGTALQEFTLVNADLLVEGGQA